MYRLHGFSSQNTKKALYVLEELELEYEFKFLDLFKGEHKTEDFQKLTPVGKVPLLEHNDHKLFESQAICRYLANVNDSPLYPTEHFQRAQVDQWLDFFSCHLGAKLNTLFFENIIKPKAGMGDPDKKTCEEAEKFAHSHLEIIDNLLKDNTFLTGKSLSIADLVAFAYIEQVYYYDFSIDKYSHIKTWYDIIEEKPSIQNARKKAHRE